MKMGSERISVIGRQRTNTRFIIETATAAVALAQSIGC
jgi:hypothetical protein